MARFEDSIDVDVPVGTAYNQWTQFETFPAFMEGVESVEQLDERTLRWTASVAGRTKEWVARITDQTPDTRIAWKSVDGADNAGAVLFAPLDGDRSRVTLKLEAEPKGAVETVGAELGLLENRVKGDLERFKTFIEGRRGETGAWRGEIHGEKIRADAAVSR